MAKRKIYNYKKMDWIESDELESGNLLNEYVEWSSLIPQTRECLNLYHALVESGETKAEAAVIVLRIVLETRFPA